MDTHTTAADLSTIQYDIISFCTYTTRIAVDILQILFHRHGKWMMHRFETVFLIRPLQQREFCDPYKTIFTAVQKIHLTRQFQTQCTQYIPDNFIFISSKQQKITSLSVHGFYQTAHLVFCHEFCERRFYSSVFMNGDISQTLCTIVFCKLNQFVNFLSRHTALSLGIDTTDSSTRFQCILKYSKFTSADNLRYILQFHTKTQIWFVRAKTIHRILPGHPLDRQFHIHIQYLFEQVRQQTFIYINHIVHIYKRQLHINLRKFRLTVCTKVLITETTCNLDITVITGAHQQLFEQLWRLWQCVKVSRMDTARYQIISCTFRCALCQHRSFNLQKSLICHKLTDQCCYLRTHHQVSLDIRSSQIQETVFQTQIFFCLAVFFNRERRCFCLCKNTQTICTHFDLTGL